MDRKEGPQRNPRLRDAALLTLALLLAVPTLLSLAFVVVQVAHGGPTGIDAHETMVKVGYWLPIPVFLFFAALLIATIWVMLRLKARDRDPLASTWARWRPNSRC
jgi:hypothetical protein